MLDRESTDIVHRLGAGEERRLQVAIDVEGGPVVRMQNRGRRIVCPSRRGFLAAPLAPGQAGELLARTAAVLQIGWTADRNVAAKPQPVHDVRRLCNGGRLAIADRRASALQFLDGGYLGILDAADVGATSPTRGQQRSGDGASRRFSEPPKQDLISLSDQPIEAREFRISADRDLISEPGSSAIEAWAGRTCLIPAPTSKSGNSPIRR